MDLTCWLDRAKGLSPPTLALLCLAFTPITASFASSACVPVVQWTWDGATRDPLHPRPEGVPAVAQLTDDNADGRIDDLDTPDVVFLNCGGVGCVLSVVDGQSGSLHFQVQNPVLSNRSPAVADLDGDGLLEIIVMPQVQNQLLAFDHTGSLKWTSDPINPNWPRLTQPGLISVADLDQDGAPEVYVGLTVLDKDGKLRWEKSFFPSNPLLWSTAIDLDPTRPGLELLTGQNLFDAAGNQLWAGPLGDGFTAPGDLDGDGDPEIVLARIFTGQVHILDHLGNELGAPLAVPGVGQPIVADIDGDGRVEAVVAGSSEVLALGWNGSGLTVKWQAPIFDPSRGGALSSYDFDGDGAFEVLYQDQLEWFIFDGRSGAVLSREPAPSGTIFQFLVVADLDHDCRTEILVTSNTGLLPGRLIAYECDAVPGRRIWNQALYHVTNINDDGSVPRYEAQPWGGQKSWLGQVGNARAALGPTADAGLPVTICVGETAHLDGSASIPCDLTGLQYRWLDGATIVCPWSLAPTCDVMPLVTTVYTLEVSCIGAFPGCVTRDDVVVSVAVEADTVPADLGNTLRAIRARLEVWMSWASERNARTYGLYRQPRDKTRWPPVATLNGLPAPTAIVPDVPAVPEPLYFYRVFGASCSGIEGP